MNRKFLKHIGIVLILIMVSTSMSVSAQSLQYIDDTELVEINTDTPEINTNVNTENTENDEDFFILTSPKNKKSSNIQTIDTNQDTNESKEEKTIEQQIQEKKAKDKLNVQQSIENYRTKILESNKNKKNEYLQEIEDIESNISEGKLKIEQQQLKIDEAKELLPDLEYKIRTLKQQVDVLNNQIELENLKIELTIEQIENKKADIVKLMQSIKINNILLNEQKQKMLEFIEVMYQDLTNIKSINSNEESIVKLLLEGKSFAENQRNKTYLQAYENQEKILIKKLHTIKNSLIQEITTVEQKRGELTNLYEKLKEEQLFLNEKLASKNTLINQTEGEEFKYKILIKQYEKEQENITKQIEEYESEREKIQQTLRNLEKVSQDQEAEISDLHLLYQLDKQDFSQSDTFFDIWPVDPSGGITAHFREPTYPFGVHNAVDLRQKQGSLLYAPGPGYVYKVKDNGMGYSYIILAHKDNVLTVHGHIFEFLVQEGDTVQTGDVIGKTGGMPGTKGAGWMTTGPHLHLEVLKDGEYQDPMYYFPLHMLPERSILDKYKDLL